MIILLFIESRLNFKNIPLNSTFKSSINYEYIVYRNENPISCFLEFLVSLHRPSARASRGILHTTKNLSPPTGFKLET